MATLPRIHLNGTHATTLLSGYAEALAAVDRAILAVLNITVHGRDYYVISDAAIDEALAVFVGLVFYAAWVDVMDEAERHDFKHRHHHK
jgi:hypothetical protein